MKCKMLVAKRVYFIDRKDSKNDGAIVLLGRQRTMKSGLVFYYRIGCTCPLQPPN